MRALVPAFVFALLATPAFAQSDCAPRGPIGFLTSEQHMMHFADMQKATAGMTFDAMRDYRFTLRQKICAMNAAEREKFTADLSKRWNALSADEQKKIKDDMAAWRGRGWGRGAGRGGGWGRGGG